MKFSPASPVTSPAPLPTESEGDSSLIPADLVTAISNCLDAETQPLFCMHCPKGFSDFQALSQHTEIVQSPKSYLCSQPGSPNQYRLLQDLKMRIKAVHQGGQNRGVPGLVPAQSRNENLSVKRQEPKPVTTSTVTRPTDTDSWIPTPYQVRGDPAVAGCEVSRAGGRPWELSTRICPRRLRSRGCNGPGQLRRRRVWPGRR